MSKNTTATENVEITNEAAELIVNEGNEKFAYVEDKDPTSKQAFYAEVITALTGVPVSPKQYQAMIVTHRYIQASDLNRARADYRPRSAESVVKASNTLLDNASSLLVDDEGALISKSATHIPEDVFTPEALARLAASVAEEVEEAEAEEVSTEEPEGEGYVDQDEIEEEEVEMTKKELVAYLNEISGESKSSLNKKSKADLIALMDQLVTS